MHLNLIESCAEAGIYATSEAERAYWLSREKGSVALVTLYH
ncbi:hypothetical protein [Enterobacter cloacae]|nr:hypothetical protein [Enterobacter cloacae]